MRDHEPPRPRPVTPGIGPAELHPAVSVVPFPVGWVIVT
jgi:hypothetical protein